MAMERTQHLVVVLHGFHAMRIYEEIVVDRKAATSLFRMRLSEQVFSDVEWLRVEPKAWEFLVHKEFEARRLPKFEAVRVPIRQGGSVVLDTRCLHGGAPGDGSPGLRAHRATRTASSMMTILSRYLQVRPCTKSISPQSTSSIHSGFLWGPGARAPNCGGHGSTAAAA